MESAVEFLLETLAKELLNEANAPQKSVATVLRKETFSRVEAKLRMWRFILNDLDAKKTDKRAQKLKRDIRHFVYELEDVLDIVYIRIKSRRLSGLLRFFMRFNALMEYADKIREINTIISRSVNALEKLKTVDGNNTEEETSGAASQSSGSLVSLLATAIERAVNEPFGWFTSRSATASPAETRHLQTLGQNIVGMNNDIEKLRPQIVDAVHQVICIYGVAGVGKTSLAAKLCSNDTIRDHFELFAWIDIMTNISTKNVFQQMLDQLVPEFSRENTENKPQEELKAQIFKILKEKKCLLVLDDMWSEKDWEFLCTSFPSEETCSKVLLTTSDRKVAEHVAENKRGGTVYPMKPLNIEDSLQLLWQQAFSGYREGIDDFNNIGVEIVTQCRCIPIYIVAVGAFLATKHTLQEWEMVLHSSKPSLPVIASSFDGLPYYLKPCFLCFGMFPKGSEIEVEHLYLLWKGEGMIFTGDSEIKGTMLDVGERYLSELAQRNMVSVTKSEDPSLGKYMSCKIHDLLHDLCLLKGKEYFFEVLDLQSETQREENHSSLALSPNEARRMVLFFSNQDNRFAVKLIKKRPKHLRTLLLVNSNDDQLQWPQEKIDLTKFRVMRVLNFERLEFRGRKLPRGMTRLIHLRYLSFRGCILKELPWSIGNLSSLLILDLRVSGSMFIPNVLNKMKKLTHLYLPLEYRTPNNDKLCLDKLTELEILVNFNSKVCKVADLLGMNNLLHLSATLEGNLEDVRRIASWMNTTLRHPSLLHYSVKVNKFHCYTEERHSAFRELLHSKSLHTLHLDGHLGYIVLQNEIISRLTNLVLECSRVKEDPMMTLDKLPKLKVLVLKENAYVGKEMRCLSSGFPELERLELLALGLLETLVVDNGAVPKLSVLEVKNCSKWRKENGNVQIPDGLKHRVPPIKFDI